MFELYVFIFQSKEDIARVSNTSYVLKQPPEEALALVVGRSAWPATGAQIVEVTR